MLLSAVTCVSQLPALLKKKNVSYNGIFNGKDPDAGRDWGQEEKGVTEGEMVGWHHPLDGHGFG